MKQRPGDQPLPTVNDRPDIQSLVIKDLEFRHTLDRCGGLATLVARDISDRRHVGIQRYGTALQPFNGRNAKRDAYEELLDFVTYAKQCVVECADFGEGRRAQLASWSTLYSRGLELLIDAKAEML